MYIQAGCKEGTQTHGRGRGDKSAVKVNWNFKSKLTALHRVQNSSIDRRIWNCLKMQAACSCEMLVSAYNNNIWSKNLEDCIPQIHSHCALLRESSIVSLMCTEVWSWSQDMWQIHQLPVWVCNWVTADTVPCLFFPGCTLQGTCPVGWTFHFFNDNTFTT